MSVHQSLALNTSASSISSSSHASGTSTPPTEISSALSSPIFAPPAETEESVRRRQQSDQASSEIGKRLLKGWAMLAEECPGLRCYGVPLVRPPKPGGGKDPRKVCVICGTTYVTELDATGWERLVVLDPTAQSSDEASASSSSRTIPTSTAPAVPREATPRVHAETPQKWSDLPNSSNPAGDSTILASTKPLPAVQPPTPVPAGNFAAMTKASLARAGVCLEEALNNLCTRLDQQTSQPGDLKLSVIANTADTIRGVALSLSELRKLQEQWGA